MNKFILYGLVLLISQSIFSQKYSMHYYLQKSVFESIPDTEDGEIIFLGNSITAGGHWSELFNNLKYKNRGVSGDETDGILYRLKEITDRNPAKIFLLIGINDLARGKTVDSILSNYRKIVLQITKDAPNTRLYLQSVLPVNSTISNRFKSHTNKDSDILSVNNNLKNLAKEFSLVYIDLFAEFADAKGRMNPKFSNDGLHINGEGYQLWKKLLKPYLQITIKESKKMVEFRAIFGRKGNNNGEFLGPVGIWVDDEKIYVADRGNNRIQVFNRKTHQFISKFGKPGSEISQFKRMNGVAVDGHRLFITDRENDRIQVFDKNSFEFITQFGKKGKRNGEFRHPIGIWIDSTYIYITDSENHRIQVFDKNTFNYVTKFGEAGNENGNFFKPTGIVVDDSRIYVAEWGNNRVQVFHKSSHYYLGKIDNQTGIKKELFSRTHGVAVSDKYLYVGGVANTCVQVFDKFNLGYVGSFGSKGAEEGQIEQLHGFYIKDGLLYMPEYSNHRVQIWKVE